MIDVREEIDALVAFEGRGAGTDAERRAGRHLSGRLEALGRETNVEATWIRPGWAVAHTAYALTGIVASVVSTVAPLAGLIAAAVSLVLMATDLGGRLDLGRLLTGRRASQNVVSPERGGRPGTLVLVAHFDAGRSGYAYGWPARLRAALAHRARVAIGPFQPLLLALAALTVTSALRTAGEHPLAVLIVQFVATVVLIAAVPLLADIALSDYVPGANDNASGVATVLRLAERYGGDLDHFDVWVLFTGGGEALAQGMREWLRRHRRELDPAGTVFLNVDAVGRGRVRYARRAGPLLAASLHPRLVELCDQIAAEDADADRYGARSVVTRSVDDARAVRRAGFPAASVSCRDEDDHDAHLRRHSDTPGAIDDAALERAFRFCSELVELIDERIGPELGAPSDAGRRARRRFSRA